MADNTTELQLYKKDPATDGGTNFNVKTMLNDNWDKLDARALLERAHRESTNNPHSTTAAQVGAYTKAEADTMAQGKADAVKTSLDQHAANKSNPHAVTAAQTGAYTKAEADTMAQGKAETEAGKVQTDLNSHKGSGGNAHAAAVPNGAAGFMLGADKDKLDKIAAEANKYIHPTGDGNQHVPATGTGNNGKVLKAGSTAGSAAWGTVAFSEVGSKPTTLAGYGITDAAPSSHVSDKNNPHAVTAAQVGAYTKTEADTMAQGKADTAESNAKAASFPLVGSRASSVDLNTYDQPGVYALGSGLTNKPTDVAEYGVLTVVRSGSDRVAQTYYAVANNTVHTRYSVSSATPRTWTGWTQVATQDWVKGFGLGDIVKDTGATDFNAINETGFYKVTSAAGMLNAPETENASWYLINMKYTTSYKVQFASKIIENGKFYMRTNLSGTWSAWTRIATQDWVKNYGLGGNGATIPGDDLNNITESGLYIVGLSANAPKSYGTVIHTQRNSDATQLYQTTSGNDGLYIRRKAGGSGLWSAWTEIVTDNAPTWTNLTLQNGATINNGRTPQYCRIGKIVFLRGEISSTTGVIGTLPSGYYPSIYSHTFAVSQATSAAGAQATVSIGTSGAINVLSFTNAGSGIVLSGISFVAD